MCTMKCVWLLIFIFVTSSLGEFDNRLLQTFSDVQLSVSDECTQSLALMLQNLNSSDDPWALKMLDATSKIPVGLLFTYNLDELGEFDQCLDTESADGLIKGKYCLGNLAIGSTNTLEEDLPIFEKLAYAREAANAITGVRIRSENETGPSNATGTDLPGPTWAICLPSQCTDEDMVQILNTLIGSPTALCTTKEDLSPPLTDGAIATIVILSFFAFLLVASTAFDLYYHFYKRSEPSHEIFVAFSAYRNGEKLFKINKNSTELTCLNGVRLYSMMWVIIGHVYTSAFGTAPLSNYKAIIEWTGDLYSMAIVNGTLSVDSFFLLSGLLVVYGFMNAKRRGVNFNIFKFYLHRYLRLTPVLAIIVLISANLLKYISSGPNWAKVDSSLQEPCRKYWWTTLLYVQNYVNEDKQEMCVTQTWYLSVDMQLYILSPLILIPLWKYPKIGLSIISLGIIASIITSFCIAYENNLWGLSTNLNPQDTLPKYNEMYYYYTHTRAAPWFIGALLGYVLADIKFQSSGRQIAKTRISKWIACLLWAVCFAVLLTCVYGGHSTLREEYDRLGNAFYIALLRPAWSVALSWVIFACVAGYGGPVNWFLSLPLYQVLNRFTYSVYLIHLSILSVYALTWRRAGFFSDFNMAYSFWGITMLSFALSVLFVLVFESPVIILEKLIFQGGKKRTEKVEHKTKENGAEP